MTSFAPYSSSDLCFSDIVFHSLDPNLSSLGCSLPYTSVTLFHPRAFSKPPLSRYPGTIYPVSYPRCASLHVPPHVAPPRLTTGCRGTAPLWAATSGRGVAVWPVPLLLGTWCSVGEKGGMGRGRGCGLTLYGGMLHRVRSV